MAATISEGEGQQIEGEPTTTPTATPVVTDSPTTTPTATPAPTQGAYTLKSPKAKYKKSRQKGIHYHKVKGQKVYQITSYTTDTVELTMSHNTTYSVYGGASKKEIKRRYVTVSKKGVVKCATKYRGQDIYTIIQAISKETGQTRYIYIHFKKKISSSTSKKVILYEKHKQKVSFNYGKKNLCFSIKKSKVASINKKGVITAKKKGKTTLTVKVKGSVDNEMNIDIVVKEEPWIVSKKDTVYDYNDMTSDLRQLASKYSGKMSLSSIGQSYDDREIWCMRIGNASAKRCLVIDAAIHAREWKNTQVIMRQAEEILREYSDHRERFQNVCIYILPMDNPDGVTISQYGYQGIRNKKLKKLVKKIGHTRIWKANARGVDLNDNFPAGFKKSKKKKATYAGYSGKKAASEKETKALMKFINAKKPDAVINLHSTGSVLYWNFNVSGTLYQQQTALADKIHYFNGYYKMPKSSSTDAAGGFADWLVYKKGIPSVTVETGSVACPLPHSQYDSIYKKNNKMLRWFMLKY